MHLFVTKLTITSNQIVLNEDRVIHHMGRVLRIKLGEQILVQEAHTFSGEEERKIVRYMVEITEMTKKSIKGKILSTEDKLVKKGARVSLLIALPNSADKLSLIVQKLTEIGVDQICFWRAKRSQMKALGEKKLEKLHRIAIESVEQCQRRTIPEVSYIDDITTISDNAFPVVFDMGGAENLEKIIDSELSGGNTYDKELLGIVGPEGGLSDEDYDIFGKSVAIVGLGTTILRMETAAIIAAWNLVQVSHRL